MVSPIETVAFSRGKGQLGVSRDYAAWLRVSLGMRSAEDRSLPNDIHQHLASDALDT